MAMWMATLVAPIQILAATSTASIRSRINPPRCWRWKVITEPQRTVRR